jgi:hypothetical protein
MRKSINPMFGLKIRGEASSGSAPSLIVLMSLRQLFLGELHSCIARLRFAGRSIFSSAGYLSTSFYECGESRLDLDGPAQANY